MFSSNVRRKISKLTTKKSPKPNKAPQPNKTPLLPDLRFGFHKFSHLRRAPSCPLCFWVNSCRLVTGKATPIDTVVLPPHRSNYS
ncbi:hypothetical protein SLEP1_g15235 [Rubroshorea leprosula]|uniref:Uncharacterized protein n=1 Tax=Rubroshorea leprosula TaxID=152421 RepID=A0AAV5IW42_9ROSI|nr:hypothetical protein SLEP1_g15235 [Rubroshorea leprosula]